MSTPDNSLVQFDFHGDTLAAMKAPDGRPMIVMRRICAALGVSFGTQRNKLQKEPWATVFIMNTVGNDGKRRPITVIDRRTLLMWLARINVSKVAPHARPKLIVYQREVADVLDRVFGEGVPPSKAPNVADLSQILQLMAESQRQIISLVTRITSVESLAEEAIRRTSGVVTRVESHAANPGLLMSTRTLGDDTSEARAALSYLRMRLGDMARAKAISSAKAVGMLRAYAGVSAYRVLRLDAMMEIELWIDARIAEGPGAPPPPRPVDPGWTAVVEQLEAQWGSVTGASKGSPN